MSISLQVLAITVIPLALFSGGQIRMRQIYLYIEIILSELQSDALGLICMFILCLFQADVATQ